MSKTVKIYVGILVVLFVGILAIEFSKPKPINWRRTYNENHKIPYGTFILLNEINKLLPDTEINNIRVTPFEYFDEFYNWKDSTYITSGTYMLINEHADLDEVSAQELLDFTSHGNTVFISSNYPPQKILDSLAIEVNYDYNFKGKAQFSYANPNLKRDSITIEKGLSNYYFSKLDSTSTTVLGYQKFDSINHINFVKVNHGFGNFYLHLQPITFTNYHLLKENHKDYAAASLSYISDDIIHFDSRNKIGADLGHSPLRFILGEPALRWAWYIALISLVCFMIFNAKRKQRIIKVIKPLENTTIAFTKTIGNLYYETKDHNTIIDKKITYFLEYLRRVYYLDTQTLDDKFIKNLSLKSGKKQPEIKKLITIIRQLKAKRECYESDLLRLNRTIEDFYTK
ncbi:DUF4350 domain-containing protein [Hyunsoonleella aestuarii]|uniref:DUF4350 domain-containing protein n=1 Tax=Hyunsoonleella aestuarii TaxID=912802 RepID=A0ABP8ECL5_9FLAO|nr:DUF4350 domain-containing protein [Hyunsoonleella aestuarii]